MSKIENLHILSYSYGATIRATMEGHSVGRLSTDVRGTPTIFYPVVKVEGLGILNVRVEIGRGWGIRVTSLESKTSLRGCATHMAAGDRSFAPRGCDRCSGSTGRALALTVMPRRAIQRDL